MAKLYKGKLSRNDNDEKNVEGITTKLLGKDTIQKIQIKISKL